MQKKEKIILIFFGPPGSGKGTQAEMMSKKLKLPTISSGELLRSEISAKTKIGKKVEKITSKGKLVSDKTIENLLFKRTMKNDAKKGFILDGYPRKKSQLINLIKMFKKMTDDRDKIFSILVDVSDGGVKSRLGGRRMCACGATYHLKFNPPKKKGVCDLCGSKLFTRNDDKPEVISKRLKLYHKEITSILDYWKKHDKLIKINGEQSIKKVHGDIIKKLKKLKI